MLISGADEPSGDPRSEVSSLAKRADRVFGGFEQARGILLAVSGGPDSMSLMLLAGAWLKSGENLGGANPPVFVATVDHQLRAESRFEAESVGHWAQALGLSHKTLTWEGTKPKARVQELAREARYRLLCAYADEIGADHLMTAHHADDQAETILFRLLRGSGLKGLGGMKRLTPRQDLVHARPLLAWPKADLIALCQEQGQAFFEDPSNRNPAYARTRLKALTKLLAEHGLDRDGFVRLGVRLAKAEAALEEQAEACFRHIDLVARDGGFDAEMSSLRAVPEEIFERVLAKLIVRVSGRDAIRLDRLEALGVHLRQALAMGESFASTLGGAALRLTPKGVLHLRREPPRVRGTGSKSGRETGKP